jgi:hypothetical protein
MRGAGQHERVDQIRERERAAHDQREAALASGGGDPPAGLGWEPPESCQAEDEADQQRRAEHLRRDQELTGEHERKGADEARARELTGESACHERTRPA